MKSFCAKARRSLLGLPREETSCERRGFRVTTGEMRIRLEEVGAFFLSGYHAALEHDDFGALVRKLNSVYLEGRGFAFEGAAMGLALRDFLTPWRRNRVRTLLAGGGNAHAYMIHVGVGWVWARLPFRFRRWKQEMDPLLGWLAFDGWGFHEGFFHWPKYVAGQPSPARLRGYEHRVFDQGLGRSFWFVNGGNEELVAQIIANFSAARRADLWSGVGLAATYAGMVSENSLQNLRALSGQFRPQLAQGAAFAAKARQRAGNLTGYTSLATNIFCDLSADEAARLSDEALENLDADTDEPQYEIWRRRIQDRLQNHFSPTRQGLEAP
ncbi:MAG TPA: DUF1702 family protein [Candidatus Acidoferrales bacterium]|nr:DUF1702 family protein [Candidatus Acidoferrales bacterium]